MVVTGRRQEAIDEFNNLNIPNSLAILADSSDIDSNDAVFNQINELFGKVDILFLNAGIGKFIPFSDWTPSAFDELMNINVRGPFFTLQKGAAFLNDGASVMFNASVSSQSGMKGNSVYGASTAAIKLFSRVFANELSDRKIRVNTISPGPTATPIWSKIGLSQQELDGMGEQMINAIPLKRFGESEEVAKVALFLASDDSSFVNGIELFVDGGMTETS